MYSSHATSSFMQHLPPRAAARLVPRQPRSTMTLTGRAHVDREPLQDQAIAATGRAETGAGTIGTGAHVFGFGGSANASWAIQDRCIRPPAAGNRRAPLAHSLDVTSCRTSKNPLPRPSSSSTTSKRCVAWCRMLAVSLISTMKVDCPLARSSCAPMRVKMRSTSPMRAFSAGTWRYSSADAARRKLRRPSLYSCC